MKATALKIFIAYWVMVIVVNLSSDWIAPDQLRRPPFTRAAMRSAISLVAIQQIKSYELSGCADAAHLRDKSSGDGVYLADLSGNALCGDLDEKGLPSLAAEVSESNIVRSRRFDSFQVVACSIMAPSGRKYIAFLKSTYDAKPDLYGWLIPGPTTLVTSGVVTLVFAILLVVPLRRLRVAAGEIASGHLEARVKLGRFSNISKLLRTNDEIWGLTHDFNLMADRLQSLVDAQRRLLRDVSHELRSPLARVNVATELARREATDQTKLHLDRVERETERLNSLIGQLLSLSHMEATQQLGETRLLLFGDVVKEVLPDVQYEASARRCRIAVMVTRNCAVKIDAQLIRSAIENIIRNAIRYTPEGGVVHVDLDQAECEHSRMAVVRVSDNGPGVPEEELAAILRPFYRVDKSRQHSTGGFGVGLAIADRAVRLHGGKVVAINRPNGGLTVEMSFPLA